MHKIPKVDRIIEEACLLIPSEKLEPYYVKGHFSEVLVIFEKQAHELFLNYQRQVFESAIDSWTNLYSSDIPGMMSTGDSKDPRQLLLRFYPMI
jgi:hypothetical protein